MKCIAQKKRKIIFISFYRLFTVKWKCSPMILNKTILQAIIYDKL